MGQQNISKYSTVVLNAMQLCSVIVLNAMQLCSVIVLNAMQLCSVIVLNAMQLCSGPELMVAAMESQVVARVLPRRCYGFYGIPSICMVVAMVLVAGCYHQTET
ncbi:hypothetical protein P4O66_000752 [Electrophorus voltai]|uniref:Uncharacterized protein n=1 Tax=Electrophorus voltai TaxID=2609070 RepID=A0AAD8ZEJ9_9TELE|nr:hypothetical protein P4O66_000752 [Electrophorus voltai]